MIYGIRSLIRFGRRWSPRTHSVLYLHISLFEASPKAISRRTSYLQVRLEFHPYPQVIQTLFNVSWFGPPRYFTNASTCSWVDHLVSGLHTLTFRPFQTRFRLGSVFLNLASICNSLVRSTKSTPLPLRAVTDCKHTVSGSVSLLFRGAFHLSLTVLVLYRSLRSI